LQSSIDNYSIVEEKKKSKTTERKELFRDHYSNKLYNHLQCLGNYNILEKIALLKLFFKEAYIATFIDSKNKILAESKKNKSEIDSID